MHYMHVDAMRPQTSEVKNQLTGPTQTNVLEKMIVPQIKFYTFSFACQLSKTTIVEIMNNH